MTYFESKFTDKDDFEICLHKWTPSNENEIKGLVFIIHGIAEHMLRYDAFSKELNEEGFVVYGQDLRGHGKSIKNGKRGHFGKGGWNAVILNLKQQLEIMKEEYPEKPIFMFAHSGGGLLAQDFIEQFGDEVKGVILSSTFGKMDMLNILILVGKIVGPFVKKDKPAGLFHNLSVGTYKKHYDDMESEHRWISTIKEVVDTYERDPLCGFRMTNQYFLDASIAVKRIWKKENEEKIPKDLPILFISTENEPISKFNKNLLPVVNRYKKLGIKDIDLKIYKEGRHEILNDVGREQGVRDILAFFNKHV